MFGTRQCRFFQTAFKVNDCFEVEPLSIARRDGFILNLYF